MALNLTSLFILMHDCAIQRVMLQRQLPTAWDHATKLQNFCHPTRWCASQGHRASEHVLQHLEVAAGHEGHRREGQALWQIETPCGSDVQPRIPISQQGAPILGG